MNLDVATSADVAAVLAELREMRAELAQVRAVLPTTWISLREAAQRLGVDPRTVAAMGERGEITIRRAGRRVLVDATSLRPADPAEIVKLAREARQP